MPQSLSDDQWKVFELIAEEQPHPPVRPLEPIAAELMAMGLVARDTEGCWITTPQGDLVYRDSRGATQH
jgi:hypothetical protein